MKTKDWICLLIIIAIFAPFLLSDTVYDHYQEANRQHPYLLAFAKFALLATFGEMIGLRIKNGNYTEKGFGILPRAVVWGLLGTWIAIAMKTFASGVPGLMTSLGLGDLIHPAQEGLTPGNLLRAFLISLMMNTTFGPVFMTLHKITDTHILNCQGKPKALITPIPFGKILSSLNWKVQWQFVFKKTIPLFWIPAHTITFLLPPQSQVLFAASLSIVLGVILSIAAVAGRKKENKN